MGSNDNIKKEQIIPFEKLLNRGVQTDAFNQIEKSFFKTIYEQAFSLVRTVCNSSERALKLSNQSKKSNGKLYFETHNVIAFTGRRGTGKTSAMLSIANYLCDKTVETIQNKTLEELRDQNNFFNLGFVDTSVLDGNEDMFLILLSKIFDFLNDRFDDTFSECAYDKYSSLKEKICLIYDHYVNLKTNSGLNLNSSYNLMDRLSERFGVRNEFAKLVEETISLLNYTKKCSNKNGYLVICLDDIDMTLQEHIHVMQCIHQYFMIPNVIVMITTNFNILTASLKKDNFKRLELGYLKYDENNVEASFNQTQDFLRKVIPSDMRITMPSWKKKDYGELFSRIVSLSEEYNSKDYANSFIRLQNSNIFEKKGFAFSPKQLIMFILAERTDIYLDAYGNKMHFMEPESLRSIYDMFYMLYGMNNLKVCYDIYGNKSGFYRESRMANRKILLDYLNFKIVPGYDFTGEEQRFVRSLQEAPIERRGKIVWDYYYIQLTNTEIASRLKSTYGEGYYNNEIERLSIENYSMGEVYRILHAGSRLGIMDKKLIKYILASFSFSIPQFIEKEKWRNSENNSDYRNTVNNYKKIRDLFQYSLIGTWCFDLFNGHYVDAVLYHEKLKSFFESSYEPCNSCDGSKNDYSNHFALFFQDLIYLLLLSSRSTRQSFYVTTKKNDKDEIEGYTIDAHIDPTAFIVNSFRIEERFHNMSFECQWGEKNKPYKSYKEEIIVNNTPETIEIFGISSLICSILKEAKIELKQQVCHDQLVLMFSENYKSKYDVDKIRETINQMADDKIKLYFINQCFEERLTEVKNDLSKKENNLDYLLKHTDLSYNVIKRSIKNMIYRSDNNLKETHELSTSPFYTINKFYMHLADKLKEQDELYFKTDLEEKSEGNMFFNNFIRHPIINKFIELSKDKKYSEKKYKNAHEYGCGIDLGNSIKYVEASKELIKCSTIGEFALLYTKNISDLNKIINYCSSLLDKQLTDEQQETVALAFLEYNNDPIFTVDELALRVLLNYDEIHNEVLLCSTIENFVSLFIEDYHTQRMIINYCPDIINRELKDKKLKLVAEAFCNFNSSDEKNIEEFVGKLRTIIGKPVKSKKVNNSSEEALK